MPSVPSTKLRYVLGYDLRPRHTPLAKPAHDVNVAAG